MKAREPGTYYVDIEGHGCVLRDSIELFQYSLPELNLGNDTTLCAGDTYPIYLDTTQAAYLWGGGSMEATQTIQGPATYSVTAWNEWGCSATDSLRVGIFTDPPPPFQKELIICQGEPLTLSAGYPEANAIFTWNGTPGDSVFHIQAAGVYTLKIETPCATRKNLFSIGLEDCSCDPFIPNVFSPNLDGVNDEWEIRLAPGVEKVQLQVFDRWGKKLFQSQSVQDRWKGMYKNQRMAPGVYYWTLSYECFQDAKLRRQSLSGWLTLML